MILFTQKILIKLFLFIEGERRSKTLVEGFEIKGRSGDTVSTGNCGQDESRTKGIFAYSLLDSLLRMKH